MKSLKKNTQKEKPILVKASIGFLRLKRGNFDI